MIRRVRPLLLVATLCASATPGLGWGSCAHRVVAEIAERRLSPGARDEVTRMLGDARLADVSFWADRVRETEPYEWTRRLHYVNLPEGASSFDAQRDCPERQCIVGGIRRFSEELADGELGRERSAVALKFLVHLVGDIHQPLHVSLKDDLGGNLITVVHRDRRQSLHRLWDSGLFDCGSGDWRKRAAEIDRALTDEQISSWKVSDPVAWAMESWELAHSHAYAVPAGGKIDETYLQRNAEVVRRRLAMAGIRLAQLLERLLSAQPD